MNKIFAFFAAIFVVFALGVSGFAKDLDVDRVSSGDLRKWGFMSVKQATKEFAGYSYTMSRSDSMARKYQKSIPFAGTAVFYFAPNNRVYVWAKREERVIVARWWVGEPMNSKGDPGRLLLCFDFVGGSPEYYTCPIIKRYGQYIHERVKGNVFKLKAGRVPKVVKSHKRQLQKVMDDLKG